MTGWSPACPAWPPGWLGAGTCGLLATVLPSLRAAAPGRTGPPGQGPGGDMTGRYRIYRGMRRLLEELAGPHAWC